jgi:prepilin-type processing-associated H-X9-DG protein
MLHSAKEAARKTKCLTHIRQVNDAALQYADDYDGKFVALNCYDANPGTSGYFSYEKIGWAKPDDWKKAALYPYLKGSKEVLTCPSDIRKVRTSTGSQFSGNEYTFNYTMPAWMTWIETHCYGTYHDIDWFLRFKRACVDGVPISDFKYPSKTMSFVDESVDIIKGSNNAYQTVINNPLFIGLDRITARHNGAGCVAYLDGHVGTFTDGKSTYADIRGRFLKGVDAYNGDWDPGYEDPPPPSN